MAADSITEFDSQENDELAWRIVDDGVMGGLSKGKVSYTKAGTMKFQGKLSLENNGGFSSVRSSDVKLDLGSSKGLAMRVKGDGRTYQLRLSTEARYRFSEVGFKAEFTTIKGEWTEVQVPFSALAASWRGRRLSHKFDPSKIQRLTFLLGDKKPGSFKLEVDWVRAYGSETKNVVESPLADNSVPATKRILAAIDKGVPLYNQGNPKACADVYQTCMEALVDDKEIAQQVRDRLVAALAKAKMTKDSDSRAWLLRQNLDGALAHFMQTTAGR